MKWALRSREVSRPSEDIYNYVGLQLVEIPDIFMPTVMRSFARAASQIID